MELDFYSRPVTDAGKKLWELLVTDETGAFRHVEAVPAAQVNSRELRARLERLIEDADAPPTRLRYFRREMQNMIAIATRELDSGPAPLSVIPSRATYALRDFIDQRERDYYPSLPGYKPAFTRARAASRCSSSPRRRPARPAARRAVGVRDAPGR